MKIRSVVTLAGLGISFAAFFAQPPFRRPLPNKPTRPIHNFASGFSRSLRNRLMP